MSDPFREATDGEAAVERLLAATELVDPPADLVRHVMARIEHGKRRTAAPFTHGGMQMARRIMLALSAAAAVLIVVVAMRGWPPVGGGIAGDITQAKRYQAQQLHNTDVVLEDTEAHRFIQSDAFDRLLKDETVRQVLRRADVRALLSDARAQAALRDPSLRAVVDDPAIQKALSDPAIASALARPAFQAALASPGFRAALLDLHLAWAMAHGVRGGCDDFGCGTNSPVVDGAAIW